LWARSRSCGAAAASSRAGDPQQQYFVPQAFLRTAFDGDTVAVVPFARTEPRGKPDPNKLPEAEVVDIVERTTTTVTGRLQKGPNSAFVVPDDERIRRDVYVPREEAARAKDGDKVVAQLLPWLDEHRNPEGKIIEVLGPTGDARVEVLGVRTAVFPSSRVPAGGGAAGREVPRRDPRIGSPRQA